MTNFGALMMSHQGLRLQSLMTKHGLLQPYDASYYTSWCLQHHGQDCIKSDLTNKQKLLSVDFLVTSVFWYHILLATFTVWLHHIKFQLVQARNAYSRKQDPPQPSETESSLVDILSSSSSDHKSRRGRVPKKIQSLFLVILKSGFWSVGGSN